MRGFGPGLGFMRPTKAGVASSWYDAPAYALLSAVADFNNNRYAITTVSLANVPTATAAELKIKRAATFAEVFTFTDGASNVVPFSTANGKNQLYLSLTTQVVRLSPLIEAILARSAGTVVIRGVLASAGGPPVIFGAGLQSQLYISGSTIRSYNGVDLGGPALDPLSPWGAAITRDATGRSISGNGGIVGTDANGGDFSAPAYLARHPGNSNQALGYYDFMAVGPDRVSNAALQSLAVPANP